MPFFASFLDTSVGEPSLLDFSAARIAAVLVTVLGALGRDDGLGDVFFLAIDVNPLIFRSANEKTDARSDANFIERTQNLIASWQLYNRLAAGILSDSGSTSSNTVCRKKLTMKMKLRLLPEKSSGYSLIQGQL